MQSADNRSKSGNTCRYLVGMGANLESPLGPPLATLIAALASLEAREIKVLARSPWFESEPVPKSDQPWFVNAAICVETSKSAGNLLKTLHEIEIEFGRVRSVRNAARPLDLDLLAILNCGNDPSTGLSDPSVEARRAAGAVQAGVDGAAAGDPPDLSGAALILPHPRINERPFVLLPLLAIAPGWRDPLSGRTVAALVASLPAGPTVRLLRPEEGSQADGATQ